MEKITLNREYITLGQLLKVGDFVNSGAETKEMVKILNIYVNKEKENRRGRKLYAGDVIEIEERSFLIEPCQ